MIKSNIYLGIIIFKKNLLKLTIIDIIIFSLIININIFDTLLLFTNVKTLIAIVLIRKPLMSHSYTKLLEDSFFIAGARIKKLVLINFYFNNFVFLTISAILLALKLSTLVNILESFFILNLLICISFLLKFITFFKGLKQSFLLKSIKILLYYLIFGFLSIGLTYPKLSTIIVLGGFLLLTHYYNRTLNYDDIS